MPGNFILHRRCFANARLLWQGEWEQRLVLLSERQSSDTMGHCGHSLTEKWDKGKGRESVPAHIKSNPGCDNGLVVILFLISLSEMHHDTLMFEAK